MNGLDCGVGCGVLRIFGGGGGFCRVTGDTILANFDTYTTMVGCDFSCGARGKCTIRGGDGLPVELMEFSVDE